MGFRPLRVINDERVAAGLGFGAHAHRDMEILSYVIDGKLAHKDSMGHIEVLEPNEIQKMSAGSGVVDTEFYASESEPVHFLQLWIERKTKGEGLAYQQLQLEPDEELNRSKLLAAPTQVQGTVQINQDALMAVAELTPQAHLSHALVADRAAWLHVISGEVTLNGQALREGDAASIQDEQTLEILALGVENAEVLLFNLD